jgi:GNAT superfamily N-acetyltransferase
MKSQNPLVESLLMESVTIRYFSTDMDLDDEFDDPYAVAEQAEAVFRECKIGVNRDKDLTLVAMDGDVMMGALYASSSFEDEDGNEYMEYSFDVAVKPEAQKSGIGTMLVTRAMREASGMGELPVKVKVWVVNPNMERVLERMGFSDGDECRHGDGSCHMEKWL